MAKKDTSTGNMKYTVTPTNNRNDSFSNTSQSHQFQTIGSTVYSTMLLSIGITAPDDIYFSESIYPMFTQVIYLAMLSCLFLTVLNMLIAVFSDRVSQINLYKHEVMQLQAVVLLMYMECIRKYLWTLVTKCCTKRLDYLLKRKHIVRNASAVYLHAIVENENIYQL